MAERWYRRFFTADWWSLVRDEYTEARTGREAAYLDATLAELAPGRRVLDLGCGTGRHAVALARAGYHVTGVDAAPAALELARERAAAAGVEVDWVELDLLDGGWPGGPRLPEVDAAICVQSFGWGGDGEQLRLLRRVHRCLAPGGVLILDHSNLAAILGGYVAEARVERADASFRLRRRFDVLTGRSTGEVVVRRPGGGGAVLRDDLRLYLPHEVAGLLRAAGFEVVRADADFTAGAAPARESRYVQFVARRAEPAATRLALRGHAGDAAGMLDLRRAPDEAGYVRDLLDEVWREATAGGATATGEAARAYALDDPFGAARAAPVLAAHLGHPVEEGMVALGAGSTGLLHDLAALAAGGAMVHDPLGHPDLPAWARRLGARTVPVPLAHDRDGGLEEVATALAATRPAVVLLDRPDLAGRLVTLDHVARLAGLAAEAGAVLVVDEACATYAGPAASATRLAASAGYLAVVRSMSKGYCCGGLRVGYLVAGASLMADLRDLLTPLATSALATTVALRLLGRGDALGPLRARIAAVKPLVVEALSRAGLEVTPGHPCLPWVTLPLDDRALAALAGRRVAAKRFGASPGGDGEAAPAGLLRLSVPLAPDRVAAFLDAFPEGAPAHRLEGQPW